MSEELILIVEDNEKNRKLLRDVLRHHGYRTLESHSGEEGIEAALSHQPDLILMDIQLPGMSGIDALEQLKEDPRTAAIPVAAVTASAMTEDQARIRRAGFRAYLAKPISVRDLLNQVADILSSSSRAEPDEARGRST